MSSIKKLIKSVLPLVTDTNPAGERKLSIGRAPLLAVLVIMIYQYATKGVGPDNQVLAFITLAMLYNGFSKSKAAGGSGGEGKTGNPFPDGEGS